MRGSAWVFAGRMAASFLGLVVYAALAHILKHRELGAYFLVLNVVMIGSTIGEMGLDRTVVRFLAASMATGDLGRARRTVRNVLLLGSIGSLVSAAVFVLGLGTLLSHHLLHSPLLGGVLVLAGAWLVASALQGLLAETLRGFQNFGLATLFGGLLVNAFSLIVFGGAWLWDTHPSLAWVVVSTVSLTSGSCLVAGLVVRRRVRALGPAGDSPMTEILAVSWPLLITSIASFMVGTGVDLWVVGAYGNQADVAVYGAASRLALLLATPFLIVGQVVPPIIAELHAGGKRHQLERSVRAVSTVATLPALLVMGVFVVAGGTIMGLVYGSYYARGAAVLAVLSGARVFAVATGSSGTALMMTGHQRMMMGITVTTGFLSVGAELVLVHPFGMIGVAIATATAQVLQNSLQLVFAKQRLGIWTHARFSLKPFKTALKMAAPR